MARAASTGGSRSYRGQRPFKWYGVLALICVLGVALVWYSRYERQHPSSSGQPTVGTKWFDAIGFDICGTVEANLSSNPPSKGPGTGITTVGDGVLHVSPTKASQAGANATLGAFVSGYKGLVLTSTSVRFPGVRSSGNPTIGRTLTLGQKCPAGTPDAGKHGVLTVDEWTSPTATKPVTVGAPSSLKLGDEQEIEVGFLPKGAKLPKPPAQAITTMLQDASSAASGTSTPSGSAGGAPTGTGLPSVGSASTGSASVGSASVGSASTGSASTGSASTGSAASTGSRGSSG